jgi:hypothetical protein
MEMQMEAHPRPKRGKRNIFCPYYAGCLDYAAHSRWMGWSCRKCRYQSLRVPIGESIQTIRHGPITYELPQDQEKSMEEMTYTLGNL